MAASRIGSELGALYAACKAPPRRTPATRRDDHQGEATKAECCASMGRLGTIHPEARGDGETELPEPSWVKMSQVRTLSTERLGRRLATVAAEELDQVNEGLLEVIP